MVTANVDIAALKARHDLGDTVEAAGVRLRGRGRVRQGVCPFHDEAEGSFTVYSDSEKFWCFGCGEGGDVLDFIQKSEGLSLPEAIARLDGSPGLAPRAANRPARTRRPASAALAPRDPALLTAAARFYAGMSPAFDRSAGVPGLAGRRPRRRRPPRPRLCAGQRSAAGPGVPRLLREAHQGLRAVHGAGSGAVRRHGRRPRRLRRPRPLAEGPGGLSRPDSPLPGPSRPQAGARTRQARHRSPVGRRWPRGSSTGSSLPDGASPPALPWAPRALSASPRPSAAVPASSLPSTTTTRGARRRTGF